MKGITILFVILGHLKCVSYDVKHVIFAFHMPLFFILSGFFYHRGGVRKDVRRLVVPYCFTGILVILYHVIRSLPSFNAALLKRDLVKIFWGSGMYHSAPVAGDKPYIGAIWFLLALFWCKTVFGLLEKNLSKKWLLGLSCVGISSVSILIDKYIIYLPMSILPGLAALFFFYLGYYMKNIHALPCYLISGLLVCFIFVSIPCLGYPLLSMVNCNYGIYPLSVIGACGGTILVYYVSKRLVAFTVGKVLSWIGQLTLPVLCFHLIQLNTSSFNRYEDNGIITIVGSLLFPLICAWICSKISILRTIFGIKF